MKRLIVVAALVFGACATDPEPQSFISPDGKQAFAVTCSNSGMAACYTKAREACSGDFQIIQTVDTSSTISDKRTGQVFAIPDQRMMVTCSR